MLLPAPNLPLRRPAPRRSAQPCAEAAAPRTSAPAEPGLPTVDVRAIARRAAVPAGLAAAAAAVLVAAGKPTQAFADALERAVHADARWVAAAALFELLSFAGYVALLWLVAGRATPRMGVRESAEVTLGGAAATRLVPTGGVGGAALTLWALRRTGLDHRHAGRTLLTFLVLLYAVFLGAIAVAGTLLALGADGADGPLALTAIPAALATAAIVTAVALGLRHGAAGDAAHAGRPGRVRSAGRLLGEAVHEAIHLVRGADARLLGALAWWAFDAAVLWAMLDAFGAGVPLLVVVLAYFVGQVGNLIPIPGAVSGGIAGVLLAFGVDTDLAIVSVLGYRAVAIWLPAPIGLAALASLRTTLRRWAVEPAPAG
ncbi:MAG TPA: YbhN family protein [Baekduia sp.]|uniref:lysylphosphatidylglycerol synthase transmembrane domain-containing protein n=1 Tax=Baekduia sp. TaxID=2600305 RepID=UPI002C0B4B10|nr:YbhN family protein [Baekduia sp.]HMJ34220.1 YbhN family protein [Baekduia sp.]